MIIYCMYELINGTWNCFVRLTLNPLPHNENDRKYVSYHPITKFVIFYDLIKTLLPTTMSNEPWSPLHFELAFIEITLIDLSFIMITAKPYYVSISKGILCALASPNQRNKTNVPLFDPILMALSKMDKMSGIE